jgi:hypothetical protein
MGVVGLLSISSHSLFPFFGPGCKTLAVSLMEIDGF